MSESQEVKFLKEKTKECAIEMGQILFEHMKKIHAELREKNLPMELFINESVEHLFAGGMGVVMKNLTDEGRKKLLEVTLKSVKEKLDLVIRKQDHESTLEGYENTFLKA